MIKRHEAKDRDALKEWRKTWGKAVKEQTYVFKESKEDQQKRINRCRKDYAAFVEYYFPHYATSKCGDFHIKAARQAKKEPQCKEVKMWARGHAKSTHFTIMIPLWLKIQEKKDFNVMVLVSKSEDSADLLISDLQTELEHNQRYINDFGIQIKHGSWEEGNFVTADDRAFFSKGRGQSPRGMRHRQHRPDYIVVDDLDDDELCRNPDRVEKMYRWLIEALYGTMDMGNGRFVMVGNLISNNSVLKKVSDNPQFKTSKVNALDNNGEPSWYQKYSKKQINSMIETMGFRSAQKELFNNPIADGTVFKNEWLQYEKPLAWKKYDSIVAYCDPSFKNNRNADYKAVMVVGSTKGKLQILKAFVRKCSIKELVTWFYDFQDNLPSNVICQYFMEANFMQDMILDEFTKEGESRKYQLPIRGDKRKKPDKFARIEAISPLFERGLISISDKEKENNDMNVFIEQLLAIAKGSRSHDDAPDALEGAINKIIATLRQSNASYSIQSRQSRSY